MASSPTDILLRINAIVSGTQGVAALSGAIGVLSSAALGMGTAMVVASGQLEQTEVAFTTLLGSGEKAKAFLSELASFAANTPFELKGISTVSQQLLAFGFSAQQIIPILTAVGNAAGSLGAGQEGLNSIARTLGQIRINGRLASEDMGQLVDSGVAAWSFLAKAVGKSVAEVRKMTEKGLIDSSTALQAILEGMQAKYAGGMAAQSKTLLGLWSNVQDNASQTAAAIGDSLVKGFNLKEVVDQLQQNLGHIRAMFKDFDLQQWAQDNRAALYAVGGAITVALLPAVAAGAVAVAGFVASALPFVAAGAAIGLALNNLGVGVDDLRGLLDRGRQAFEGMRDTATTATGALMSRVGPILANLRSAATDAFSTVRSTWERVLLPVWQDMQPIIENAVQGVMPLLQGFSDFVRGTFAFIRFAVEQVLIPAFEWIWPHVKPLLEFMGAGIRGQLEFVGGLFRTVGLAISGHWGEAWESVRKVTQQGASALGQALRNLLEPVGQTAVSLGRRLRDGILSGMDGLAASLTERLVQAIQGAVAGIPKELQDFLGISGAIAKLQGLGNGYRTAANDHGNDAAATAALQGLNSDQKAKAFFNAIFGQESSSSGGYSAINTQSGALGKYQVMGQNLLGGKYDPSRNTYGWMAQNLDNIGVKGQGWDYKALGRDVTMREFIASPQIQEAVAQSQMAQNLKGWMAKFPNDMQRAVKEAALDWYGRGTAAPGNPTGAEYAASIWARFKAAAGIKDAPAPPATSGGPTVAAPLPKPPANTAPAPATTFSYANLAGKATPSTADRAKALADRASDLALKFDLRLIGKDEAIQGLKAVETQAKATAAKGAESWQDFGNAAKAARSSIDSIKKSGQSGQDVLSTLTAQFEYAGKTGLPAYVKGLQAYIEQQQKAVNAAQKGSAAQLTAIQNVNRARAALKSATTDTAEQARVTAAAQQADELASKAAAGSVEAARLRLDSLSQARDRAVQEAGTDNDRVLRLQQAFAPRLKAAADAEALATLAARKAGNAKWQEEQAAIARKNITDETKLQARLREITAAGQLENSNAYRAYYAQIAQIAEQGRTPIKNAQKAIAQQLTDGIKAGNAALTGVLADPNGNADGSRGLIAPYTADLADLMAALPQASDAAQEYIAALGELAKQGVVTAQDLKLVTDQAKAQADFLMNAHPYAGILADMQATQEASDEASITVDSLTTMLQGVIANGLDPQTSGYVQLLDEIITKGGKAGQAATDVKANLDLLISEALAPSLAGILADPASVQDGAGGATGNELSDSVMATLRGHQNAGLAESIAELTDAQLKLAEAEATAKGDGEELNLILTEQERRATATAKALRDMPATLAQLKLNSLDRQRTSGQLDAYSYANQREAGQVALENAQYAVASANLSGTLLEVAQKTHEDRLTQIHADGEAARKAISDQAVQDSYARITRDQERERSSLELRHNLGLVGEREYIEQRDNLEVAAAYASFNMGKTSAADLEAELTRIKLQGVSDRQKLQAQEMDTYKGLARAVGSFAAAMGQAERDTDRTGNTLATPWKDLAANIDGATKAFDTLMTIGTDVMKVLANPADIGSWVKLITDVVNSVAEAIGGFKKAYSEAAQAQQDFRSQFKYVNADTFSSFRVESRGWFADVFGGGPKVVKEIKENVADIARTIESGVTNAFTNGIKNFLNGKGNILTDLRTGIRDAIIDAITQAILQGAIVKGALGGLLTDLTNTLANGGDVTGIISQIAAALPAVSSTLETALAPLKEALDKNLPAAKTDTGTTTSTSSGPTYSSSGSSSYQSGVPQVAIDILGSASTLLKDATTVTALQVQAANIQLAAAQQFGAWVQQLQGPHNSSTITVRP